MITASHANLAACLLNLHFMNIAFHSTKPLARSHLNPAMA